MNGPAHGQRESTAAARAKTVDAGQKLDLRRKKAALEGESRKYSRMLSSISYGKIKAYFLSRGYREGVEIQQVNPAFSSVIGRVKFMERYGLSVHQAAALVLARRLLGCSERIPRRRVAPVGNGVKLAFTVPCEEASEARVDVLGCDLGSAETGACSATPAGEAETWNQSGSGCRAEQCLRGGLNGGSDRCSLVRVQGGVALHSWGGGAAQIAHSGMAEDSRVTKINHFYNGCQRHEHLVDYPQAVRIVA